MRIATWNINSIRSRIDRVVAFLERWDVDVLALQETKCREDQFPKQPLLDAGYEVAAHGINQWNGVAIVSRVGLTDVETDFGQPEFSGVLEPRALSAVCGGVRVWSLYVPHGRERFGDHYSYKLTWLAKLNQELEHRIVHNPDTQELLVGDWNIAPFDEDVWDINEFEGSTHVSPLERAAFNSFAELGMVEVTRNVADNYTYWDYQKLRFPRNQGMRIDFMYASQAVAKRVTGGFIDRDERKGKGASDHVPVAIDLAG